MRIAIIEGGHWHVPLYLPAFGRELDVVAVSDSTTSKGAPLATRLGARFYQDYRRLLDEEQIDFVFAFGRHTDMPAIAKELIARRLPFSIEKPCGRSAADVAEIRKLAEAADLYVAVPYVLRYTDIFDRIRAACDGELRLRQAAFRFIAGLMSPRYDLAEATWLADKQIASGGSTINVGHHFYDALLALAAATPVRLTAMMHICGDVEDYSVVSIEMDNSALATIETGYMFPNAPAPAPQRDFYMRLITTDAYLVLEMNKLLVRRFDGSEVTATDLSLEMDQFYPVYATKAVDDWISGRRPRAGLGELEAVMRLMDAAYRSASSREGTLRSD
jgi:predicted dehydrogenase